MNLEDRLDIAMSLLSDFNKTLEGFPESEVKDELCRFVAEIFSKIEDLIP